MSAAEDDSPESCGRSPRFPAFYAVDGVDCFGVALANFFLLSDSAFAAQVYTAYGSYRRRKADGGVDAIILPHAVRKLTRDAHYGRRWLDPSSYCEDARVYSIIDHLLQIGQLWQLEGRVRAAMPNILLLGTCKMDTGTCKMDTSHAAVYLGPNEQGQVIVDGSALAASTSGTWSSPACSKSCGGRDSVLYPQEKNDCFRSATANLLLALEDSTAAARAYWSYHTYPFVGANGIHATSTPQTIFDLTGGRYLARLTMDFPDSWRHEGFRRHYPDEPRCVADIVRREIRDGQLVQIGPELAYEPPAILLVIYEQPHAIVHSGPVLEGELFVDQGELVLLDPSALRLIGVLEAQQCQ